MQHQCAPMESHRVGEFLTTLRGSGTVTSIVPSANGTPPPSATASVVIHAQFGHPEDLRAAGDRAASMTSRRRMA
jgi:hypothetical protein